MTATGTPPSPTLLTRNQQRVAARLVYGASDELITRQVDSAMFTMASHLVAGRDLDLPSSSRAVLAHALLTAREVLPPSTTYAAIGDATGGAADVRAKMDAVVAQAGADNVVHLAGGLAHAWGILTDTAPRLRSLPEPAAASAGAA
ncbi:hypothetical protein [Streptomyces mutabilis]|uniref:hypothetical protein n=1 Tax=Streptomyces mutabilis TaxID=67332 RepID=UPI000693BAB7|nr:hypothetical protein [Streptomyces mutabilis]